MSRPVRIVASFAASVFAVIVLFLSVFPSGCTDQGGVPSWERCTTPMGMPAFSVADWGWDSNFNILLPVLGAALVGLIVWLTLGRLVLAQGDVT